MKKIEIINEYNALTDELNEILNQYLETTGQEYTHIGIGNMDDYFMSHSKDDLTTHLECRKRTIRQCKEKLRIYTCKENMLKAEDGKAFYQKLQDKYNDLLKVKKDICENIKKSFEDLIHSIDMEDWKINNSWSVVPDINTRYFKIYKGRVDCNIELCISKKSRLIPVPGSKMIWSDPIWVMEVNTSVHGSSDITKKDIQYYRFQGYLNICDHSAEIQKWMETVYQDACDRIYEINNEVEDLQDDLDNPYDAWVKSTIANNEN